jgi:phosphopantothenoylcysteine decarboxylase / phosphopantothenate---cysteine ligase
MLTGKKVLLGVTGSIAAIKAPIIARELMRKGATVVCAMTESAQQFTTPTALAALTQNRVITSIFPKEKAGASDAGTWHVHLGRSVDLMVIAPCSATMIGKLANGIYDDPVSLLSASLRPGTPVFIAPAMDEEMWLQQVVQANVEYLDELGFSIIPPIRGALASGLTGEGRMQELPEMMREIENFLEASAIEHEHVLQEKVLMGKNVLITGGPTYEPIDPVRFIGNRSSGKMAAALAQHAAGMGANVTLVMGPSSVKTSGAINRRDAETAEEMLHEVMMHLAKQDIIIMNAAVSDFAADTIRRSKIKKRELEEDDMSIRLRRTTDILSKIAESKRSDQMLVGFALETGDQAESYALSKLKEKSLDMIVLNRADVEGAGFSGDTNKVIIFDKSGKREELDLMSKDRCAFEILSRIAALAQS